LNLCEKEKHLINQIADQKERSDMLALAMMVAFRKYQKEIVRTIFREERELMKQSDFIQEFIEEGWQEGRIESQLALITRLVGKKQLGRIPNDVIKDIKLLSYEQLEELILAFIDMTNLTELKNWLDTHSTKKTTHVS